MPPDPPRKRVCNSIKSIQNSFNQSIPTSLHFCRDFQLPLGTLSNVNLTTTKSVAPALVCNSEQIAGKLEA